MTAARRSEVTTGIAFAVTSAIAFGTMPVFAKHAYDAGAEPIPLLAGRFTTAAVVLIIFTTLRRETWRLRRTGATRVFLLGALAYAFESALFFAALERAPASVVTLVFYSYPLWTSLGGFATRLEPFDRRLIAALALSGIGLLLIFSVPTTSLAGPLIALAAALAVTVYYLFAQVVTRDVPSLAAAIHTAAGAAFSLTAVSVATTRELPSGALVWACLLGLVTAIAFACLYAAIIRIGSARTAVAHMLEPVTTVVLAIALLGEVLTWKIALGAALVVSALPILALRRSERAAPPIVEP